MKSFQLLVLTFIITLGLLTSSCEENLIMPLTNNLETDPLEETVLKPSNVLENLLIEGATLNSGSPTSSNKTITLELDNPSNSAFLINGFTIPFKEPTDDYIGAYLQIKSIDGELADGYWNIPNISSKKANASTKNSLFTGNLLDNKSLGNEELVVNFNDNIGPGKFCYVISLYDANGNVSEPKEICLTVENWGGNTNLIGDWELNSIIGYKNNILTNETITGVEICFDRNFNCQSTNSKFIYEICQFRISWKMNFKEDGTFYIKDDWSFQKLNNEASQENCEIIFHNENESRYIINEGNWAFNEEEGILTLITFYNDFNNRPSEFPNGNVHITGSISLNNDALIITENHQQDDASLKVVLDFSKM